MSSAIKRRLKKTLFKVNENPRDWYDVLSTENSEVPLKPLRQASPHLKTFRVEKVKEFDLNSFLSRLKSDSERKARVSKKRRREKEVNWSALESSFKISDERSYIGDNVTRATPRTSKSPPQNTKGNGLLDELSKKDVRKKQQTGASRVLLNEIWRKRQSRRESLSGMSRKNYLHKKYSVFEQRSKVGGEDKFDCFE